MPNQKPPAGGANKALAAAALLLVLVGSVVYTVVASKAALTETRSEKDLLQERQDKRKRGFFVAVPAVTVQPNAGCSEAVVKQLNDSITAAQGAGNLRSAQRVAQELLSSNPSCPQLARAAAALERQVGGVVAVNAVGVHVDARADAAPDDAGKQLAAAYFANARGNGTAMKRYLERADAADANAPLLHGAWAVWWDLYAQPRDFKRELDGYESELSATEDPAALRALISIRTTLEDADSVEPLCQRWSTHWPPDGLVNYSCLTAAITRGDAEAEARWRKAYFELPSPGISPACKRADLASMLFAHSCRDEEALKQAQASIDEGCLVPGNGQRRKILLRLRRFDEAAAPPPGGEYWRGVLRESDTEPDDYWADQITRAEALVLLGREQEAHELLTPIADKAVNARILSTLIEDGRGQELGSGRCPSRAKGLSLTAGLAGLYTRWGMVDDARTMLARVLAEDPKNSKGITNMVHVLTIDGKVDEAIALAEDALKQDIDDGVLEGDLGYAYQLKGQCDKAVPLMRSAIKRATFSEANYTNLARCLETMGDRDEAAKVWRYTRGGVPRAKWWMFVLVGVAAIALYLGGKLALIKALPRRFGHLKFP